MLPPNGGSVQRASVPGSTGTTSWCASRRIGASVVSLPAQRYSRLSAPTRSRVNATCSRGKVRCRYSWKSWNGAVSTPLAPPKEIVRNRRARASRSAAAAVSSAMAGAGSEGICRVWWVAVLATSTATSATAAPPSANRALFTMPLVFGGPLRWRLGGNAANSLFAGGGGGDGAPPYARDLMRELDPHNGPENHRHRDERAGGHRLSEDEPTQENRDHRVDVGVGPDDRRRGVPQGVGVSAVAQDRAEDDEVGDRAEAPGREMPGAPLTQREADERDRAAPHDHLERGADVRTRLGGVPLRIHGAERPRSAREGERDRAPHVGVQDLSGRRPHEQHRAGEAEQQAGHDPPAEIARTPRNDRVEKGHPQGDRHDENARDPRRGELLGPHDERVAPGQEEQSDDGGRAPVDRATRQPVAQRERDPEEQHPRREEPQAGEEERRQHAYADPDREVGRAPEDAHDEIGDERFAAQPGHRQFRFRGTRPGAQGVAVDPIQLDFVCIVEARFRQFPTMRSRNEHLDNV